MTTIERAMLAVIGLTTMIQVFCDLVDLPGARAESPKEPDRYMSQIMHEIVAQAVSGGTTKDLDGYDELEVRLEAILSRVVQAIPRAENGVSSQEIRSALSSCRLVGTLVGQTGRLDARMSC